MLVARIDSMRPQRDTSPRSFVRREEQTMIRSLLLFAALLTTPSQLLAKDPWPATGKYEFVSWAGPQLAVYYSVPPKATADSPILVIIPGVKRNAEEYRNEWDHLATANRFITLVVEATKKLFPTEYEYNVGGIINARGEMQPEDRWLFSAIDPLFDDFKKRYGSHQEKYELYGHSAGGGFVHLFLLMKPQARVDRAVAANPAFFTMPDNGQAFPFGLKGAPLASDSIRNWFDRRLVVLLGE